MLPALGAQCWALPVVLLRPHAFRTLPACLLAEDAPSPGHSQQVLLTTNPSTYRCTRTALRLLQVYYNNLLSLPPILALMWYFGEFHGLLQQPALRVPAFLAVSSLGGVLGFAISFSSLWFLSQTTATIYRWGPGLVQRPGCPRGGHRGRRAAGRGSVARGRMARGPMGGQGGSKWWYSGMLRLAEGMWGMPELLLQLLRMGWSWGDKTFTLAGFTGRATRPLKPGAP